MNLSRIGTLAGNLRSALRTQLWPLPTLGVVGAVLLGVGLPRLDARIDDRLPGSVTAYLFSGGASAARALLGAVASSLITVTSLTFSLTVVTLQLASSQFSPRLLRTFTRDRFVHVTLALFLATFTYSLTALRTIRDITDAQSLFVPQIAVTFAFGLALLSVVGLVLFLAHLAREIRVETMLSTVHRDATSTVEQVLLHRDDPPSTCAELPVPGPGAEHLLAVSSGFIVSVDETAVRAAAVDADVVLVLDRSPGDSVVAGTPLGSAWPHLPPLDPEVLRALRKTVASAVTLGFERTGTQDVGYGLRQLTDVASKALSPGINDPTTAVHAIGHISALLCTLAGRQLGPRVLVDDDDRPAVVLSRPDLGDLLEVALNQPRRYGAADPFVMGRLFQLLREVAWTVTDPGQRAAVEAQLRRLRATVQNQDFDVTESARMARLARLVDEALTGRWPIGSEGA